MRTSDRVYLEVPIIISGTDSAGQGFMEETRTLVLSQHGAKIISTHALVPQQELTLRSLATGLETTVRVIGPILGDEEGCHFGVVFLNPEANVWGINFPSLDREENPAGRVFFECANCHAQEVVHLDVFELEVFLANACLTRPCARCNMPTLWTQSASKDEPSPAGRLAPGSPQTIQKRRWPRISLKVVVCLRHPLQGQDVVTTEKVSRGGFGMTSHKVYSVGTVLEAALPYSPGAANIFTPVRIVHKNEVADDPGTNAYCLAYIPSPLAPSLTGLRITQPK